MRGNQLATRPNRADGHAREEPELVSRRPLAAYAVCLLAAAAAGAPPEFKAQVGFDGRAALRRGVPVRLEVAAVDGPAAGTVTIPLRTDRYGVSRDLYRVEVEVPAGGVKTYWLTVYPTDSTTELPLHFDTDRGRGLRQAVKVDLLEPGDELLVTVNAHRAGLRYLERDREYRERDPKHPYGDRPLVHPATYVANVRADELPPFAAGYDAVQALIVSGDELTAAAPEVRRAIEQWVAYGGHLVLVGGTASAGLWQDPVVRKLAPVEVSGLALLSGRELAPVAGRFGGPTGGSERYAVSRGALKPGATALVTAGGLPFVASAPHGAGRVSFLAAAYDQPPLTDWTRQDRLWRALTQRRPVGVLQPETVWSALKRPAMNLPWVQTPAMALVAGFLALYLIVLIPVQFPVLKKLNRRELAWVTTPVIVLVFSVGAYLLGLSLKGRQTVVATVSFADASSGLRQTRTLSSAAVFSPAKTSYDLRPPAGVGRIAELSDRVGSRYGPAEDPAELSGRLVLLQTPDGPRLPGVDINMWALRVLGFWWRQELPGPVTVRSRPSGTATAGRVFNGLDRPLTGAALVLNGRVTRLGDIPAGGAREFTVKPAAKEAEFEVEPLVKALTEGKGLRIDAISRKAMLDGLLDRSYSYYGMAYGDGADLPVGGQADHPALWAWVERDTTTWTIDHHAAKGYHLTLLRVRLAPAGERAGKGRHDA